MGSLETRLHKVWLHRQRQNPWKTTVRRVEIQSLIEGADLQRRVEKQVEVKRDLVMAGPEA